jgi:hypothetical protein
VRLRSVFALASLHFSVLLAAAAGCSRFSGSPSATDASSDALADVVAPGSDGAACDPTTVSSDPVNCGACGHDCRGATCARGLCNPGVVTTYAGPITSLAVESDRMTFTTGLTDGGNSVLTCPVDGCNGAPTVLASGQSQPKNVRVDGDTVYWVDAPTLNRVMTCDRAACTPTVFYQGQPLTLTIDIAVDDAHEVYVLVDDESVTTTHIERCVASGCSADAGANDYIDVPSCAPQNLVYDQGALYFSNGYEQGECTNGALYQVSVAGTPQPKKLLTSLNESVRVAGDPSGIYAASFDSITKFAFPTLSPTPIADLGQQATTVELAGDGSNVYWLEASGFVRRAPATGGDAFVIADQQTTPHAVALDDTYVYWVTSTAGGDVVLRAAK